MAKTSNKVRSLRLIGVAVLAIAAVGCDRDDSDNVMTPSGNSLTPAQVDAALGPEIVDADANTLTGNDTANTVGDTNQAGANEASDSAPENTDSSSAEQ